MNMGSIDGLKESLTCINLERVIIDLLCSRCLFCNNGTWAKLFFAIPREAIR